MKKSVIATYIVSAVLIVLSFVLVALSVMNAYTVETYRIGRMVYTASSYVYTGTARILNALSVMSFILGIAGIIVATLVQIFTPAKTKSEENTVHETTYEECRECDASLPEGGSEN